MTILTVVMYCISAVHLALSARMNLAALFTQKAADVGEALYDVQGSPFYFGQVAFEVINCVLGDTIVTWRTWVHRGDVELARVLHDDDAAGTNKRNLRKRGENHEMKNIPEAVVTARYLEKEKRTDREQRCRDGYLSEEESQEQEYQPPSDPEEESQMLQRRIRQKGDSATTSVGNELLPSMSESSDEDMRGLRSETD
ncbi:MAG: hypothetical protein NXY57DRAFT_1038910 [Lentinula lateritia]|nr:MAG: hypothetical protein NXY57DRAFT_1038910 [Lentinula lateritia]